ncbi:MAG: hypothetical protein N4A33_13275 [Bacteriovoracaceae bacterium]|jgi:hypothetical protein|nr:hypothetical protein [Bacteriovoracaceae bacterium]
MLIRYSFILLLLASCSSDKKSNVYSCKTFSDRVDQRAILMNLSSRSKDFLNCYKNFLKFEKDKSKNLKACVNLSVTKMGRVKGVTIKRQKGFPTSLKMCIEQQLWSYNFKSLILSQSTWIQFPIEFN